MTGRLGDRIRTILGSEMAGGILLIVSAALALLVANSPLAEGYFHALHVYLGPLSLQHWVNDALMAVFFLVVGLEIKREMLEGHLATWRQRILPGVAAAAGMAAPALVYLAFNRHGGAMHGWAIPAATDIAFALGILSLLGPRVPPALKVFLAALAIIDDLGAVIVIGLFYTSGVSLVDLAAAGAVLAALIALNRARVLMLAPYLVLGVLLWLFVWRSGVHATIAGVLLALTIPLRVQGRPVSESPLHRLEHALIRPVAFLIVPIFGFANAGVSFAGLGMEAFIAPVTMGVAAGLAIGKLVGVMGTVFVLVRSGLVGLPPGCTWRQMLGTSLLCGIGFTMSLFISLLAFREGGLQDQAKIGILIGSAISGGAGYLVLRFARAAP